MFNRFRRRLAVQVHDRDGFAAFFLPTHGHVGDVDILLPKKIADEADQAWHIAVREQQQGAVEVGVQPVWPKLDKAQVAVAKQGAAGAVLLFVGMHHYLNKRAEIAFF